MKLQSLNHLLLAILALPFLAHAQPGPQTVNFDGRLLNPDNTPMVSAGIPINIQILNPAKTCLIYEENQTVDTTATDGNFSIQVGSAVGSPKRSINDPGHSMAQVFQNKSAITAHNLGACGGTYTPAVNDERYMRVTVNSNVMSPDFALQAVPFAVTAETLQGSVPSNFINVAGGANLTQANIESIFNSTGYSNLSALVGGTSTLYMKAAPTANVGFGGYVLNNVGAPVVATDATNKGYVDSSVGGHAALITGVSNVAGNGLTLVWNQTNNRWEAGTPTATDNTKLPLAGGTMSGAIDMSTQNITNIGHITMAPQRTLHLSNYNGAQDSALALGAPDEGKIWYNSDTNQVRLWNGSAKIDVGAGAGITSLTGDVLATGPGSVAATIAASAITTGKISNGAITTEKIGANPGINRLVMTDGTTGMNLAFATCTNNQILHYQTGTGWVCTNPSSSPWGTVSTDTYYTAGNVGVGNPSPTRRLDVTGSVRFAPIALPGSPSAGDLVFDSGDSNKLKYYDGASWQVLDGGAGLLSLNGQSGPTQSFAVGGTGLAPAWSSVASVHTLNIPMASSVAVTAGLISKADYDVFNAKGDFKADGSVIMTGQLRGLPGSAGTPSLSFSGDTSTGLYRPSANMLGFSTAGVERMRLSPAGNLGVGTSTPTAMLDVNGAVHVRPMGPSVGQAGQVLFFELGANGGDSFMIRAPDSLSGPRIWTLPSTAPAAGQILTTDASGNLSWMMPPTGNFNSDGTTNMTGSLKLVDGALATPSLAFASETNTGLMKAAAGVLGIVIGGTNTFNFSSVGMSSSITGGAVLRSSAGSASAPTIGFTGSTGTGMYVTPAAQVLNFATNSTQRMTISSSGFVGIGVSSPVALLDVAGDVVIAGVKVGKGAGSGPDNVAVGGASLASNTTGYFNTAIGDSALNSNTSGYSNTAVGAQALSFSMNSNGNTAVGANSLYNGSGGNNTAVGFAAGSSITTGAGNVILGFNSGSALTNGNDNTLLGPQAGSAITTGSSNVVIGGNNGASIATASNTILISDGSGGEKMRISNLGYVGIGTQSPAVRLHVQGAIVSSENVVPSGATADMALGNSVLFQAPGGSVLTLNNMVMGGEYRVIISDTSSRTYTFSNCSTSYFSPANSGTTVSTRTVYKILFSLGGSCYIDWKSGYQ